MNTGKVLISWYNQNKRDLPWRATNDPYLIWVSEIIMQQTRINQGLPYYNRFIKQFPTVNHLATASLNDVLLLWQGLGYYSRARNMHETAKQIVVGYNGLFPDTATGLLKLKGIGKYTAAAIASICYGEQIPAIDGNVLRVISRLFNIDEPVDKPSGKKAVEEISLALIKNLDAGTYNQAIMDFGAMICTPLNPKCIGCPLTTKCMSLANKTVLQRPTKYLRTTQKARYFYYLCFSDGINTLITQRKEKDIWEGLFEFPHLESDSPVKPEDILTNNDISAVLKGMTIHGIDIYEPKVHKLSHQIIYSTFIKITTNQLPEISNCKTVSFNKLNKYAFPRLIENYITLTLKK